MDQVKRPAWAEPDAAHPERGAEWDDLRCSVEYARAKWADAEARVRELEAERADLLAVATAASKHRYLQADETVSGLALDAAVRRLLRGAR